MEKHQNDVLGPGVYILGPRVQNLGAKTMEKGAKWASEVAQSHSFSAFLTNFGILARP